MEVIRVKTRNTRVQT